MNEQFTRNKLNDKNNNQHNEFKNLNFKDLINKLANYIIKIPYSTLSACDTKNIINENNTSNYNNANNNNNTNNNSNSIKISKKKDERKSFFNFMSTNKDKNKASSLNNNGFENQLPNNYKSNLFKYLDEKNKFKESIISFILDSFKLSNIDIQLLYSKIISELNKELNFMKTYKNKENSNFIIQKNINNENSLSKPNIDKIANFVKTFYDFEDELFISKNSIIQKIISNKANFSYLSNLIICLTIIKKTNILTDIILNPKQLIIDKDILELIDNLSLLIFMLKDILNLDKSGQQEYLNFNSEEFLFIEQIKKDILIFAINAFTELFVIDSNITFLDVKNNNILSYILINLKFSLILIKGESESNIISKVINNILIFSPIRRSIIDFLLLLSNIYAVNINEIKDKFNNNLTNKNNKIVKILGINNNSNKLNTLDKNQTNDIINLLTTIKVKLSNMYKADLEEFIYILTKLYLESFYILINKNFFNVLSYENFAISYLKELNFIIYFIIVSRVVLLNNTLTKSINNKDDFYICNKLFQSNNTLNNNNIIEIKDIYKKTVFLIVKILLSYNKKSPNLSFIELDLFFNECYLNALNNSKNDNLNMLSLKKNIDYYYIINFMIKEIYYFSFLDETTIKSNYNKLLTDFNNDVDTHNDDIMCFNNITFSNLFKLSSNNINIDQECNYKTKSLTNMFNSMFCYIKDNLEFKDIYFIEVLIDIYRQLSQDNLDVIINENTDIISEIPYRVNIIVKVILKFVIDVDITDKKYEYLINKTKFCEVILKNLLKSYNVITNNNKLKAYMILSEENLLYLMSCIIINISGIMKDSYVPVNEVKHMFYNLDCIAENISENISSMALFLTEQLNNNPDEDNLFVYDNTIFRLLNKDNSNNNSKTSSTDVSCLNYINIIYSNFKKIVEIKADFILDLVILSNMPTLFSSIIEKNFTTILKFIEDNSFYYDKVVFYQLNNSFYSVLRLLNVVCYLISQDKSYISNITNNKYISKLSVDITNKSCSNLKDLLLINNNTLSILFNAIKNIINSAKKLYRSKEYLKDNEIEIHCCIISFVYNIIYNIACNNSILENNKPILLINSLDNFFEKRLEDISINFYNNNNKELNKNIYYSNGNKFFLKENNDNTTMQNTFKNYNSTYKQDELFAAKSNNAINKKNTNKDNTFNYISFKDLFFNVYEFSLIIEFIKATKFNFNSSEEMFLKKSYERFHSLNSARLSLNNIGFYNKFILYSNNYFDTIHCLNNIKTNSYDYFYYFYNSSLSILSKIIEIRLIKCNKLIHNQVNISDINNFEKDIIKISCDKNKNDFSLYSNIQNIIDINYLNKFLKVLVYQSFKLNMFYKGINSNNNKFQMFENLTYNVVIMSITFYSKDILYNSNESLNFDTLINKLNTNAFILNNNEIISNFISLYYSYVKDLFNEYKNNLDNDLINELYIHIIEIIPGLLLCLKVITTKNNYNIKNFIKSSCINLYTILFDLNKLVKEILLDIINSDININNTPFNNKSKRILTSNMFRLNNINYLIILVNTKKISKIILDIFDNSFSFFNKNLIFYFFKNIVTNFNILDNNKEQFNYNLKKQFIELNIPYEQSKINVFNDYKENAYHRKRCKSFDYINDCFNKLIDKRINDYEILLSSEINSIIDLLSYSIYKSSKSSNGVYLSNFANNKEENVFNNIYCPSIAISGGKILKYNNDNLIENQYVSILNCFNLLGGIINTKFKIFSLDFNNNIEFLYYNFELELEIISYDNKCSLAYCNLNLIDDNEKIYSITDINLYLNKNYRLLFLINKKEEYFKIYLNEKLLDTVYKVNVLVDSLCNIKTKDNNNVFKIFDILRINDTSYINNKTHKIYTVECSFLSGYILKDTNKMQKICLSNYSNSSSNGLSSIKISYILIYNGIISIENMINFKYANLINSKNGSLKEFNSEKKKIISFNYNRFKMFILNTNINKANIDKLEYIDIKDMQSDNILYEFVYEPNKSLDIIPYKEMIKLHSKSTCIEIIVSNIHKKLGINLLNRRSVCDDNESKNHISKLYNYYNNQYYLIVPNTSNVSLDFEKYSDYTYNSNANKFELQDNDYEYEYLKKDELNFSSLNFNKINKSTFNKTSVINTMHKNTFDRFDSSYIANSTFLFNFNFSHNDNDNKTNEKKLTYINTFADNILNSNNYNISISNYIESSIIINQYSLNQNLSYNLHNSEYLFDFIFVFLKDLGESTTYLSNLVTNSKVINLKSLFNSILKTLITVLLTNINKLSNFVNSKYFGLFKISLILNSININEDTIDLIFQLFTGYFIFNYDSKLPSICSTHEIKQFDKNINFFNPLFPQFLTSILLDIEVYLNLTENIKLYLIKSLNKLLYKNLKESYILNEGIYNTLVNICSCIYNILISSNTIKEKELNLLINKNLSNIIVVIIDFVFKTKIDLVDDIEYNEESKFYKHCELKNTHLIKLVQLIYDFSDFVDNIKNHYNAHLDSKISEITLEKVVNNYVYKCVFNNVLKALNTDVNYPNDFTNIAYVKDYIMLSVKLIFNEVYSNNFNIYNNLILKLENIIHPNIIIMIINYKSNNITLIDKEFLNKPINDVSNSLNIINNRLKNKILDIKSKVVKNDNWTLVEFHGYNYDDIIKLNKKNSVADKNDAKLKLTNYNNLINSDNNDNIKNIVKEENTNIYNTTKFHKKSNNHINFKDIKIKTNNNINECKGDACNFCYYIIEYIKNSVKITQDYKTYNSCINEAYISLFYYSSDSLNIDKQYLKLKNVNISYYNSEFEGPSRTKKKMEPKVDYIKNIELNKQYYEDLKKNIEGFVLPRYNNSNFSNNLIDNIFFIDKNTHRYSYILNNIHNFEYYYLKNTYLNGPILIEKYTDNFIYKKKTLINGGNNFKNTFDNIDETYNENNLNNYYSNILLNKNTIVSLYKLIHDISINTVKGNYIINKEIIKNKTNKILSLDRFFNLNFVKKSFCLKYSLYGGSILDVINPLHRSNKIIIDKLINSNNYNNLETNINNIKDNNLYYNKVKNIIYYNYLLNYSFYNYNKFKSDLDIFNIGEIQLICNCSHVINLQMIDSVMIIGSEKICLISNTHLTCNKNLYYVDKDKMNYSLGFWSLDDDFNQSKEWEETDQNYDVDFAEHSNNLITKLNKYVYNNSNNMYFNFDDNYDINELLKNTNEQNNNNNNSNNNNNIIIDFNIQTSGFISNLISIIKNYNKETNKKIISVKLKEYIRNFVNKLKTNKFKRETKSFDFQFIEINKVIEIHKRKYLLQNNSLEIFTNSGCNYFLVFNLNNRNKVFNSLLKYVKGYGDFSYVFLERYSNIFNTFKKEIFNYIEERNVYISNYDANNHNNDIIKYFINANTSNLFFNNCNNIICFNNHNIFINYIAFIYVCFNLKETIIIKNMLYNNVDNKTLNDISNTKNPVNNNMSLTVNQYRKCMFNNNYSVFKYNFIIGSLKIDYNYNNNLLSYYYNLIYKNNNACYLGFNVNLLLLRQSKTSNNNLDNKYYLTNKQEKQVNNSEYIETIDNNYNNTEHSSINKKSEIINYINNYANNMYMAYSFNSIKDLEPGLIDNKLILEEASFLWKKGLLLNYDYLLILNTKSGRSYIDINSYMILPWIISDYTRDIEKLNFAITNNNIDEKPFFRNLDRPLHALTDINDESLKEKYSECDEDIDKFHCGTIYSNSGFVCYYLIRTKPYTFINADIQGGNFDVADRLFFNIKSIWSVNEKYQELIPQLMYLPETLINVNEFNFGNLQSNNNDNIVDRSLNSFNLSNESIINLSNNKDQKFKTSKTLINIGNKSNTKRVNDVLLASWSENDPRAFTKFNKKAMESPYVSTNISNWIDLVFGIRQTGKEAVKSFNIFRYICYEGNINKLDAFYSSMPKDREDKLIEIRDFGQAPSIVFNKFHAKKEKNFRITEFFSNVKNLIQFCVYNKPCLLTNIFNSSVCYKYSNISHYNSVLAKYKENYDKYINFENNYLQFNINIKPKRIHLYDSYSKLQSIGVGGFSSFSIFLNNYEFINTYNSKKDLNENFNSINSNYFNNTILITSDKKEYLCNKEAAFIDYECSNTSNNSTFFVVSPFSNNCFEFNLEQKILYVKSTYDTKYSNIVIVAYGNGNIEVFRLIRSKYAFTNYECTNNIQRSNKKGFSIGKMISNVFKPGSKINKNNIKKDFIKHKSTNSNLINDKEYAISLFDHNSDLFDFILSLNSNNIINYSDMCVFPLYKKYSKPWSNFMIHYTKENILLNRKNSNSYYYFLQKLKIINNIPNYTVNSNIIFIQFSRLWSLIIFVDNYNIAYVYDYNSLKIVKVIDVKKILYYYRLASDCYNDEYISEIFHEPYVSGCNACLDFIDVLIDESSGDFVILFSYYAFHFNINGVITSILDLKFREHSIKSQFTCGCIDSVRLINK